ncbi:hypothetical protein FISHEDRAFT_61988 [Fistulina hepatica ATCC 64428]|uniref:Uncharacterized protein n=1 Tax=Fistulina hepatica ATCC 64428 TaxID=1128425 RepID=A0A0D7A0Z6_9AGAR|nr:hypothetical protein FISHEDRAFT_61988 [Fistulina hepatica ATCC 64428]
MVDNPAVISLVLATGVLLLGMCGLFEGASVKMDTRYGFNGLGRGAEGPGLVGGDGDARSRAGDCRRGGGRGEGGGGGNVSGAIFAVPLRRLSAGEEAAWPGGERGTSIGEHSTATTR